MSRKVSVFVGLGLLFGSGLGQVDTIWFRHHQYSPSYPYQFMKSNRVLAVDDAGNSYVCAYGQFNSSSYDLIVTKCNPDGKLVWESYCDAGGTEIANAIAVDASGAVYVAGQSYTSGSNGQMLTVKWDPGGRLAWTRKVSGTGSSFYNAGYEIALYSDAVYVAGQLTSTATGQDMALVKLAAASGEVKWTRTISRNSGSGFYETANGLVVSQAGELFIAGRTHAGPSGYDAAFARFDTDGDKKWQQDVNTGNGVDEGMNRICLAGDLVVGTGYILQGSSQDALTVACYQTGGDTAWKRKYAGPGGGLDRGNDICADGDGNVVACGVGSGSADQDALVLKYDRAGTLLWSKLYDSEMGNDEAMALDVDLWGDVAVGSQVSAMVMIDAPLVVLKYSADGSRGWVYRFKAQTTGGMNSALDVCCVVCDVIMAGITTWPYPDHSDPTVLRLREVPDVGVQSLIAPAVPPNPGQPVTPKAVVRNYSLMTAAFTCQLDISDGYSAEVPLNLLPGAQQTVSFPNWTPGSHGNWQWCCYPELGLDYDRSNDTAAQLVRVNGPAVDAGVTRLIKPDRNISYQTSVFPTASLHNFGTGPADVWAYAFIDHFSGWPLYRDSVFLSGLEPNGLDTVIRFRGWVANQYGFATARCSTWTAGDMVFSNDTVSFGFAVINEPVGRWVPLPDVPLTISGKAVYKGGGLASCDTALYVLRGNKTREVHVYSIALGQWIRVDTVPEGPLGNPVDKGGAIVADDLGRYYVVKGNKTFEFYRRDPVAGWSSLAGVPRGPKRKAPKGGTGLAYAVVDDTGCIYLLKGSGTAEFYRYNIVRDTWDSMPAAPAGWSTKPKYADGSALAADGSGRVFCLKGKYNEVFAFDIATGRWLPGQLANLPLYGADRFKRKVKHGGDICWADGGIAAIKGGNSCHFWRLEPADSAWYEYPPVPQRPERPKRVKAGGGLEFAGGSHYVLKGNKTLEFWRFDLVRGRDGAAASTRPGPPSRRLAVSPNPVSGFGRVSLCGAWDAPVALTLFDACGRVCRQVVVNTATGGMLDCRGLASGVYFLSPTVEGMRFGCKVVVTR